MSNAKRGLLIVLSGPSASGQGTVNALVLQDQGFEYSVSATTRAPRVGEVDGKNYHFITKEAFEDLIRDGGVLEYTSYCGNYYGTLRSFVEEKLNAGKNVILEIEVDGAMQIREKYPDALLIMLLPPSFAEQERRLRSRGTETEEVIAKRLSQTRKEIPFAERYDYVVYNRTGHAEDAAADILSIVRAERCAIRRNRDVAERYFSDESESN